MDRTAVETLYRRFAPMVLSRARMLLRSELAAQDALQEVFVRALRAGHAFRGASSPATWLYRITTHHCLNQLRDDARRRALWSHYGPATQSTQDQAGAARIQLGQILERMPPDLQEIALYALVDELSHDEIAEMVGVSRRTIGNRLEAFREQVVAIVGDTEVA